MNHESCITGAYSRFVESKQSRFLSWFPDFQKSSQQELPHWISGYVGATYRALQIMIARNFIFSKTKIGTANCKPQNSMNFKPYSLAFWGNSFAKTILPSLHWPDPYSQPCWAASCGAPVTREHHDLFRPRDVQLPKKSDRSFCTVSKEMEDLLFWGVWGLMQG